MIFLEKQKFQDYFYIFIRGFLGFLISLFSLHFLHDMAIKEAGEEGLISFFVKTPERQIEATAIILSFSFLGAILGKINILNKEIRVKKKRIKLLEEISETKTEFVSLVSHQLRMPLAAVKWGLKMMIDGDFGKLSGEQNKILSECLATSERLASLVADLLDISRIEQHRFGISLKSISVFEVKKIIEKIINESKGQIEKKNINLRVNMSSLKENQILIDQDKIAQVIQNLLENAIDYTPDGGKIEIKTEEKNNNLLFYVFDSGIGIPEGEREKIFTKFFRASNARDLRSGGTGLGLYLCKILVEMHNGKIRFISSNDKGTTFIFSLPLLSGVSAEEFLKRL